MSSRIKIYTRSGDLGNTSLYGGKRVKKSHAAISAYGTIDELNSVIGVVISYLPKNDKITSFLSIVQSDLLTVGSYLAGKKMDLVFINHRVKEMENLIDAFSEKIPQLKNFILPQGTTLSTFIHLARVVARRAEREVVGLDNKEKNINHLVIKFLNRLSDLLFVIARFENYKSGQTDIIWQKNIINR